MATREEAQREIDGALRQIARRRFRLQRVLGYELTVEAVMAGRSAQQIVQAAEQTILAREQEEA